MSEGERDRETYAVIGAAMEVHRRLGPGFLENVYQEAIAIEFEQAHVPYEREVSISIQYRDKTLNATYRADFVCFDSVIVELKALSAITDAHYGQVIHYLKATGFHRAVLLNFGSQSLEYKRIVSDYDG